MVEYYHSSRIVLSSDKITEKAVWRSVFLTKTLYIDCKFNKDSLLRSCFLALLRLNDDDEKFIYSQIRHNHRKHNAEGFSYTSLVIN